MTPKHFLTMAAIALVGMLTFSSCNDDEAQYHAPVYKTITFSPNPCYPGDKVTATVVYSSKGENWYYFKQVFTLDGTKVSEKVRNNDTYVYMPDPPTCTFDAPAAGTHTVVFTCSPSSTVGNNLYPAAVSVEAKLVVSATDNGDDDEEEEDE
jgi:hypothetical protein